MNGTKIVLKVSELEFGDKPLLAIPHLEIYGGESCCSWPVRLRQNLAASSHRAAKAYFGHNHYPRTRDNLAR